MRAEGRCISRIDCPIYLELLHQDIIARRALHSKIHNIFGR
jgi:hypothetical protein